jgi:exodeoxyribonuclease VII large subunit
MEQLSLEPAGQQVYTVTSLTAAIHRLVSMNFDDVRVSGEISGFKVWSSGHAYFTLKDGGAQIRCVIFRNVLRYLKFKPGDGLAVTARGSVEVRQERGEYQLIVGSMEPQGFGALQLAFEQVKRKLAEEGLFAAERKRPLPAYPKRIGIVTSAQGAAIRDMINVLSRRFPGLHMRLYPTLVQGEGAVEGICEGLRYFGESGWAEVLIVGRGGGSLEDLWSFNEEAVARAIAASPVPVVSAVGHETDFTIADFVADLRAPTPSAAAELVVRNREDLLDAVDIAWQRSARSVHYHVSQAARRLNERGIDRASTLLRRQAGRAWQRVDEAEQRLRRLAPNAALARLRQQLELTRRRLDDGVRRRVRQENLTFQGLVPQLSELIQQRVHRAQQRYGPLAASLDALSPLAVLERGYSIVTTAGGRVLKTAGDAPPGTLIEARLARGRLRATVTGSED